MQNNIVAYLTYMSLIFIVAKLWGVIDWGWLTITAPVWGLLGLSIIWLGIQQTHKNRMRAEITGAKDNLVWLQDFIKRMKETQEKERSTIN